MMLALQVAAGIIIAYAVIINQKKLLRFGRWVVILTISAAALGALALLGTSAVQLVGSSINPNATKKILAIPVVIIVFLLALSGTFGMAMLAGLALRKGPLFYVGRALQVSQETQGREGHRSSGPPLLAFGLAMLLINYLLSFPVWLFTPLGQWSDELYSYGMKTPWQDGLSILFAAFLWQWVWIPLGLYLIIKRTNNSSESNSAASDE